MNVFKCNKLVAQIKAILEQDEDYFGSYEYAVTWLDLKVYSLEFNNDG